MPASTAGSQRRPDRIAALRREAAELQRQRVAAGKAEVEARRFKELTTEELDADAEERALRKQVQAMERRAAALEKRREHLIENRERRIAEAERRAPVIMRQPGAPASAASSQRRLTRTGSQASMASDATSRISTTSSSLRDRPDPRERDRIREAELLAAKRLRERRDQLAKQHHKEEHQRREGDRAAARQHAQLAREESVVRKLQHTIELRRAGLECSKQRIRSFESSQSPEPDCPERSEGNEGHEAGHTPSRSRRRGRATTPEAASRRLRRSKDRLRAAQQGLDDVQAWSTADTAEVDRRIREQLDLEAKSKSHEAAHRRRARSAEAAARASGVRRERLKLLEERIDTLEYCPPTR